MSQPRYITPLEQAVLGWPAMVRPEELGPARTSLITHTGTGSGTLTVTGAAFDAHTIRVEIVQGGEIGAATYRAKTDGATWGDETLITTGPQPLLHTAADEITGGADIGLRLLFAAGTPTPSFVTGAAWTWTTKPVQALVAKILGVCGDLKSIISGDDGGGRYTGAISFLDVGLKRNIAKIVRWDLAQDRGVDPNSEEGKLWGEEARLARLQIIEVAEKVRHPEVTEAGPPIEAPGIATGHDLYGISAAIRSGRVGPGIGNRGLVGPGGWRG